MRAEIVTDVEALAALESAWWDLFRRASAATPFASPAWLLPWWRVFAPGGLFVVAIHDDDRLVGLAPLYRETGLLGLRLLPIGIGISDALDILVDPARADAVGALLGAVLGEAARDVDCWSAEEAPPDAAVLSIAEPPGWRSRVMQQSACPVLALPDAGALRDGIPPRQWRKWQMARNRVARRAWSIAASTPETLGDDLAHLVRLHGTRWQSRGEGGVLADDTVRRFHAAAAPALLAAGLLRLTTLTIDGTTAGACHVLLRGATAYAYLGGFDPAFAFESPGTLLIGDAIATAAGAGARAFSFLRGQEAYKYAWGAVDRWNFSRRFEPIR